MRMIIQAGLLRQPVKVQTELNVKSSNTQAENIFLHKVKSFVQNYLIIKIVWFK